jgi:hypothetical protein
MTGLEIGLIVYAAVTVPLVIISAITTLGAYLNLKDERKQTKVRYQFCIELDEPDKYGVKSAVFVTSEKIEDNTHEEIMKADITKGGLAATTVKILKKHKFRVLEVDVLD